VGWGCRREGGEGGVSGDVVRRASIGGKRRLPILFRCMYTNPHAHTHTHTTSTRARTWWEVVAVIIGWWWWERWLCFLGWDGREGESRDGKDLLACLARHAGQ